MKKIFAIAVAMLCAAFTVSAQDMAEATETAKAANEALQAGDNQTALAQFKSALEMAEMCGGEGMELAETCKGIIPKILLSMSKADVKAKNYDGAIATLKETIEAAKAYAAAGVTEDAEELLGQVYNQRAGELLNSKDFAGAAAAYKDIIASEPTNGMAQLRLGMALTQLGNTEEAIAAYEAAIANGQEKNAAKQLSTIYLKAAQASLKANKFADAIAECEKSNSYVESANAYKIAASAATKLKDNAKALGFYEKYLEVSPDAKDANAIMFTVAALAQQAGDKAKAKEFYSKVVTDAQFGVQAKQQLDALNK